MFLAANRKDEGIYYTPATITTPIADSLVASLVGPLVDDICAACDPGVCDFEKARATFARLTELRITDTAAGSGGFLIKVLRAVWSQYLRIEAALGWLDKIKLEGDLFELPKHIQEAAEFQESLLLTDHRKLLLQNVICHLSGWTQGTLWLSAIIKVNVMREIVRLIPSVFHFRRFPGSSKAMKELNRWNARYVDS